MKEISKIELNKMQFKQPTISVRIVIMALIAFSFFTLSTAQVSMTLNINIDEFSLSGTSQWFINITNSSSKTYTCYLHATVAVPDEGIIANGTSKSFSLKPFETRINRQTGAEIADSSKIDYDEAYKQWYLRNNELPSRTYNVCVELIETTTGIILTTACQELEPQKFSPPVNIYPFDLDTIYGSNLSFQWLPPQPFKSGITHSIRIVEVLNIQSPVSAFYSNNYFYTEDYLNVPVLQFPIHARPLEEGKTYAWLIESQIGKLTLKSEPTVFVVKPAEIPLRKKTEKSKSQYTQYLDLSSSNAREIQIVTGGHIPIMMDNREAAYQLVYCITGNERKVLTKGKIPVKNGHNKLLIPTTELKSGTEEIFSLILFSSVTDLPEIRFRQLANSTKI